MSFAGSSQVNMIVDNGLSAAMPATYIYQSSDSSTQITAVGYFAGCGRSFNPAVQGRGGSMRLRDIVINQETTAGNSPGRITLHSVTGSTLNSTSTSNSSTAEYNISVCAAAT